MRRVMLLVLVVGCAEPGGSVAFDCPECQDASSTTGPDGGDGGRDSGSDDSGTSKDGGADTSTPVVDSGTDVAIPTDAKADSPVVVGPITGGPCISGAQGATAFRVRWVPAGTKAQVQYEVHGLPDKTRWKASVYGYQIGFEPQWVDPYLGDGGVELNSSSFIDLELSTAGVSSITKATLSLYGRSYNTTSSGSFNWQTQVDVGSTATNSVSNAPPYKWYAGDVISAVPSSHGTLLMRVKAGPSSGAMVVNRLELCIQGT
jgi:hypothetical protein